MDRPIRQAAAEPPALTTQRGVAVARQNVLFRSDGLPKRTVEDRTLATVECGTDVVPRTYRRVMVASLKRRPI